MDTYYQPKDLPKFAEISEGAPELAQKFFDYYATMLLFLRKVN
jgi:4-carboxymuconolactone decarboxylase